MGLKYIIVGGGVAGTSAAETIRKHDPAGEITIISDEPHRFYSRIMISKPHYFMEKVPPEQIWLKKESWYAENSVQLLGGRKAVKLDPQQKQLTLDNDEVLPYDRLCLAVGVDANRWKVPGADLEGIYYVRTLDDYHQYQPASKEATQGVVIGGGAIGFEMCDLLNMRGLETSLSIRESHYWDPVLDATAGGMIEAALEKHGVKVYEGQYVSEGLGSGKLEAVKLEDGTEIPCQLACIGIGGHVRHDWLQHAGVEVDHGILVDDQMKTNLPDVYAAGDCAEYMDPVFEERTMFGSWSNAQGHGRIAGANMTGANENYRKVTFYAVSGLGLNIAFVGKVSPHGDRQFVSRGNPEVGYGRLIIKDARLVGAQFINRTPEVGVVTKLIENKTDISAHLNELADPDFDLKQLL
jgi:NAD(P)H-nitrite reductase large subunit